MLQIVRLSFREQNKWFFSLTEGVEVYARIIDEEFLGRFSGGGLPRSPSRAFGR